MQAGVFNKNHVSTKRAGQVMSPPPRRRRTQGLMTLSGSMTRTRTGTPGTARTLSLTFRTLLKLRCRTCLSVLQNERIARDAKNYSFAERRLALDRALNLLNIGSSRPNLPSTASLFEQRREQLQELRRQRADEEAGVRPRLVISSDSYLDRRSRRVLTLHGFLLLLSFTKVSRALTGKAMRVAVRFRADEEE